MSEVLARPGERNSNSSKGSACMGSGNQVPQPVQSLKNTPCACVRRSDQQEADLEGNDCPGHRNSVEAQD